MNGFDEYEEYDGYYIIHHDYKINNMTVYFHVEEDVFSLTKFNLNYNLLEYGVEIQNTYYESEIAIRASIYELRDTWKQFLKYGFKRVEDKWKMTKHISY